MYFISRSILLKALGWSLINSLWQMALLWVLYIVITGKDNRFSARAKHNLALICSAAGTFWFIATLAGSFGNQDILREGFTAIFVMAGSNFSNALLSIKNFFDLSLPYLSFIYLAILLFQTLRYFRYFLHLHNTKKSGLQKIKPSLRLFTNTVSTQMGIRRKVAVWLSSLVDSPMTIGFLKPIILIPIATVNHLTTEQVESILLHELTHIKRNDYLVNLFVTVNSMIFFFNPFSRLFQNAIKKEREHCCDDMVLQFQYKPHTYASALLSLEKTKHQHHQLAMGAVGRSNQLLLERIKRVTGHKYSVRRYSVGLICFLLLSLMLGFALTIKPVRPPQPPPMAVKDVAVGSEVKYWQMIQPPAKELALTGTAIKQKHKRPARIEQKKELTEEQPDFSDNDIRYAMNTEPENPDEQDQDKETDVQPANQKELIAFSSGSPMNPKNVEVGSSGDYPYVPNSAFTFQLINDSVGLAKAKWNLVGVITNKDMQKALTALNAIDWNKIEKQISRDGNKVDIRKLQEEIQKCVDKIDLEIHEDVAIVINRNDARKIRENLRQQITTLHELKIAAPAPGTCPQGAPPVREKLQQQEVRKQLETMRKAQQVLKKKVLSIIYI